jgi:hypothetical protein
MNKTIRTTSDVWEKRFYVIVFFVAVLSLTFVFYITKTESQKDNLKTEINKSFTRGVEVGQNSTINYIIANEKYPKKYKGNIIFVKREDLD